MVGFEKASARQSIEEWVPRGETGENWARGYLDKVLVCGTVQADAQPQCKAK